MAAYAQAAIKNFLKAADQATTRAAQCKAFEDLICYLFDKVAGISITQRNVLNRMESEEIDVALWNDQHPRGFKSLTNMLLVECKNWSAPVGSSEIITFISKLERRGVEYGFFVCVRQTTLLRKPRCRRPAACVRKGRHYLTRRGGSAAARG